MRPDPAQPGNANVDEVPQRATVTVRLAGGDERTTNGPRAPGATRAGRWDATRSMPSSWTARRGPLPAAAHDAAFEALDGIAGARSLDAIVGKIGAGHGQG